LLLIAFVKAFHLILYQIPLKVCFFATALVSYIRRKASYQQSNSPSAGAETVVITAFYSLIFLASSLRAIWFLVPESVWQPSYTPSAVYAWDKEHPSWLGSALSEIIITAGSLALFSIFILILVYWADILKKYFQPGSQRTSPKTIFVSLVTTLAALMILNVLAFLAKFYTTEGMILFHAVLLAVVSLVCVCEITIFSQKFQTVIKTLGSINQVSTDVQVRRILWITITGNLFFITRALLEIVFAANLLLFWKENGTVGKAFSHEWWDIYTALKYSSEVTILALMLYILQSRFHAAASAVSNATNGGAYERVPEAADTTRLEV
jgi:hypothetical protein